MRRKSVTFAEHHWVVVESVVAALRQEYLDYPLQLTVVDRKNPDPIVSRLVSLL
jgi:hypothetical protein